MLGEELRPGLRAWTTFHEEWDKDVRCFAIVEDERLTLIDPLIGDDAWDDLAATRGERALEILLTIHWHARSTAQVRERHPDVRARAWSGDRARTEERVELDGVFEVGDELPGGLVAIHAAPREEVLFWDAPHAALIAGDVLLGDGEAGDEGAPSEGLHLCPESWLPGDDAVAKLRSTMRGLLDLPIDLVLPSHGAQVLVEGRSALERALD
jgi:hypothetical protein